MFSNMSTGFDPRRHPRGSDGKFDPAPAAGPPDAGLAADLADAVASVTPSVTPSTDGCRAIGNLPEHEALCGLAEDPNTPAETLAVLADDPDWVIRRRVADNPSTPPEALTRLAIDDDRQIRRRVAGNPTTPTDVLVALAADPDKDVRSAVAANPNASPAARSAGGLVAD